MNTENEPAIDNGSMDNSSINEYVGGFPAWHSLQRNIETKDVCVDEKNSEQYDILTLASSLAHECEVDPVMCQCIMLAVISAISQGKFVVELPTGHIEQLSTHWICITNLSERKSSVFDKIYSCIDKIELKYNDDQSETILSSSIDNRLIRNEIREIEKRAIKKLISRDDARREIFDLEKQLSIEHSYLQITTQDATPSALIELLKHQIGNRISIFDPEGHTFEKIGNNSELISLLNSGFTGDTIKKDRYKYSGKMPKPCISLLIMLPKDRFQENKKLGTLWRDGFFARALCIFPQPKSGSRTFGVTNAGHIDDIINIFNTTLTRIFSIDWNRDKNGEICPYRLTMSSEAKAHWLSCANSIEKFMRNATKNDIELFGKRHGILARIAALIHLSNPLYKQSHEMQIDSIIKAREVLTNIDETYGRKLQNIVFSSKEKTAMDIVKKWLEQHPGIQFSARTIYRNRKQFSVDEIK
ncbi:MAG: DUF3987 domain-containing protein [Desulfovibrio sp.]|jgi:hypothetical protein|nr:DUF3987 domain-containing protein [Desulfovibrio sp.]